MPSENLAFWHDLTKPRLFPLLFAVFVSILLLIITNFNLQNISFLYAKDDYGTVSDVVRHKFDHNKLAIIGLGGSTLKEATQLNSVVEQQILKNTKHHYQFWNLASSAQVLSESLAILTNLNPIPGSIVVLGITPNAFTESLAKEVSQYQHPRIPFLNQDKIVEQLKHEGVGVSWSPQIVKYSPWLVQSASQLIDTNVLHCISNMVHLNISSSCIQTLWKNKWLKQQQIYQRYDYEKPPLSISEKKEFSKEYIRITFNPLKKNHQYSLKILQSIIDYTDAHHLHAIFLILPRSKMVQEIDQSIWPVINNDLSQLKGRNFEIVNYQKYPGFADNDFYDLYHFVPSGRNKFSPIFANMLTQYINNRG